MKTFLINEIIQCITISRVRYTLCVPLLENSTRRVPEQYIITELNWLFIGEHECLVMKRIQDALAQTNHCISNPHTGNCREREIKNVCVLFFFN